MYITNLPHDKDKNEKLKKGYNRNNNRKKDTVEIVLIHFYQYFQNKIVLTLSSIYSYFNTLKK